MQAPFLSPRFVVTLVHGTFARGAAWVRAEGSIAQALRHRFGDSVVIEEMSWSGGNHFRARRDAAEKLRHHVLRPREDAAETSHVVIAHSHAGNVVMYAARDATVSTRLAAVVTLATPFIVARRRNLGQTGRWLFQGLVLWIVFGLFYLLYSRSGAGWTLAQTAGVIAIVVALVEIPALMLVKRWADSSVGLIEQLSHAEDLAGRLLILRAVADEATGVITFLQFPSLVTTLVLGSLARLADRYVRWTWLKARHPLRALGLFLLGLALGMAVAFLTIWVTSSIFLGQVALLAVGVLLVGPVTFSVLRNAHLALVTAAMPLALLAAPVMLVLAITLLAFGPRFALANLHLDLSVEATPVGTYGVTLLSPERAGDPDAPGGLLHSVLYDDPEAIAMICDFIEARIRATPAASGS